MALINHFATPKPTFTASTGLYDGQSRTMQPRSSNVFEDVCRGLLIESLAHCLWSTTQPRAALMASQARYSLRAGREFSTSPKPRSHPDRMKRERLAGVILAAFTRTSLGVCLPSFLTRRKNKQQLPQPGGEGRERRMWENKLLCRNGFPLTNNPFWQNVALGVRSLRRYFLFASDRQIPDPGAAGAGQNLMKVFAVPCWFASSTPA